MKTHKTPKHLREKARIRAEMKRRAAGIPPKTGFDERFSCKCKSIPSTGCVVWTGTIGHSGHGQVYFNGKVERAHRVSWIRANGSIPDGLCVLHKCDVPSCVNPSHLFLGTQADNMKDMVGKGRNACGEKSVKAKLTAEDVRKIVLDGRGITYIAREYSVSPSTICAIRSGKTWKKETAGFFVDET